MNHAFFVVTTKEHSDSSDPASSASSSFHNYLEILFQRDPNHVGSGWYSPHLPLERDPLGVNQTNHVIVQAHVHLRAVPFFLLHYAL